jgi:hypothetical protein
MKSLTPLLFAVVLLSSTFALEGSQPPRGAPAPAGQAKPVAFARLGSARFRHPGPVFHAAFAPDGKTLATPALGCVSVWEVATGKLLPQSPDRSVGSAKASFHAGPRQLVE